MGPSPLRKKVQRKRLIRSAALRRRNEMALRILEQQTGERLGADPAGRRVGAGAAPGPPRTRGSVRSLMSLGVVLAAGAIAGFLLAEDSSADLTKMVVGGWIAALGNVIGFSIGARTGGEGRATE